MIVGPRVIFDKSFIQSLNGDLIEELTLYFTPTCPPTLISEIIADLKKPPNSRGRIGEDLVRMLARKMMGAHGTEPPPLRSLVVGSLHGSNPPMNGLVLPVMVGTPGVHSNETGSQLLVSQIPQQEMWCRWAGGNFSSDDEGSAKAWRAGILATNLEVERERWKPLAQQLGRPATLSDVVSSVDRIMGDPSAVTQHDLINVALRVVSGSRLEVASAGRYFVTGHLGETIAKYAPFAASIARLYMCFALGMACDLLGTRRTNTIDLQYLFYAPFCRVFVSNDLLHRDLLRAGAVTSEATFVDGETFRTDLKHRNDRRRTMTFDEWAAHRRNRGQWPETIENSIISQLWEQHCSGWPRGSEPSPNVGKTIDEIDDPHLASVIKLMTEMRDEQ